MLDVMLRARCAFAAAICCLFVSASAHAGLTGLYAESVETDTLTNTSMKGTTYRIYLQFDDDGDRFVSALDADIDFVVPIYQDLTFGTDLGGHNPALDNMFADLAADSYVTVTGAEAAVPGADPNWNAAQMELGTGINGGWFVIPPTADANAVDGNGRVLVMFLTFPGVDGPVVDGMIGTTNSSSSSIHSNALGDLMQGTIRFAYNPGGAVSGGITPVSVVFDPLPSPGALAMSALVLAGWGRRRRRRCCA